MSYDIKDSFNRKNTEMKIAQKKENLAGTVRDILDEEERGCIVSRRIA